MLVYFDYLGDELTKVAKLHYQLCRYYGLHEITFDDKGIMNELAAEFGEETVRAYERRDSQYRIDVNSLNRKYKSSRYSFKGKEHSELTAKLNYYRRGGQPEMWRNVN